MSAKNVLIAGLLLQCQVLCRLHVLHQYLSTGACNHAKYCSVPEDPQDGNCVDVLLATCRFAIGGMRIDGTILQQEFLPDDFMRHWMNNFTTILTYIKVRPQLCSTMISWPW